YLYSSEVYYIISGKGIMHINSQIEQVEEGSTIYIPPKSIQFIENTGSHDLVFLCIVDPAWKKEDEIVL
ncbi:MAG: cupin domain-containing protein, partial [Candidatus Atribacteria bacterium]|nr:cupin domain-containing protein [Candidatus Atribacteria bacterium]